jgi:isochorismate hydrolase
VRTANTWIHSFSEDINFQKRNLRDLKKLKMKNQNAEDLKIDGIYAHLDCNSITKGQLDQLSDIKTLLNKNVKDKFLKNPKH